MLTFHVIKISLMHIMHEAGLRALRASAKRPLKKLPFTKQDIPLASIVSAVASRQVCDFYFELLHSSIGCAFCPCQSCFFQT